MSERKLDKLLSEKAKARRRKLSDVNIKVTFMIWLIEFVGSLLLPFIPKIFSHGQSGTAVGATVTFSLYFVLLPLAYLMNNSDIKNAIVEENWLYAIRGIFNRTNIETFQKNN